ncbi:hypothetical protein lerEdw1_009116 [Lerista edwardsae]|nr:hypothetical protein lerEdw1_009116 [Lerista edwardsae]
MASPRALRFCWAPSRAAPAPTAALRDFQLRAWHGLCLGSALLGLLGVLLLGALRRHKRGSRRAPDDRLATARALRAAAIASGCLGAADDALLPAGILVRSVLWLAVPSGVASPLCILVLTWVQYWFAAHFWALFGYSLEAFLLLRSPAGHRSVALYHLLCWGLPATQCLPGLLLLLLLPLPPAADERCSASSGLAPILDGVPLAATYVPLALALLGSPVLFSRALRAVPALLRRGVGMYTAGERHREQQLHRKFVGITTAFAACWTPNVMNEALLLLELSWGQETWLHGAALTCWTLMAVLNPLSGFLLALGFSARGSNLCARQSVPTWRTTSDMGESSSRNCSPLPEPTTDPALGFLGGPGMQEASSLLASLDSSTSMDFICAVPENSCIRPLHWGVREPQEELSPRRGPCQGTFLGGSCRG